MPSGRSLLVLAGLVALGLAALGTAAADEPQVHPLTSAGSEDEIPAGVPVTMGWVLTDGEGQPVFHQDARFEVSFEDEVLLATTPASGHDYDGVDPYQVAFPGPGNYTVTAQVHDDGEVREVTYEGQVGPAPEQALDVAIDAPEQVPAGQQVDVGLEVTGPAGEPVEEAEVTIRVQRAMDRFEVLKTRLSVEDGQATLRYAFERTGDFQITAVGAPLPGAEASLAPTAATHEIAVDQPRKPSPSLAVEEPLNNDRETAEAGDDYELFGTYDPYTSIGPHGRVRLGMLTIDEASHEPVPDVAYQATIMDPQGRQIFHSAHLDAADGFEYVTISRPDPGTYTMRVDAEKGDWSEDVQLEFTVLPPAGATNAGPLFASPNASASLEAQTPATFPVYVEDAAGVPLFHGEVDFRFVDADTGVPTATGKLHVHTNGTMPVTIAPTQGGEHRLEVLPQSLQPAPTPFTYGEEVGQPPVFDVDVTPVEDEVGEALESQSEDSQADTPGLGALATLMVATLLALATRRS